MMMIVEMLKEPNMLQIEEIMVLKMRRVSSLRAKMM